MKQDQICRVATFSITYFEAIAHSFECRNRVVLSCIQFYGLQKSSIERTEFPLALWSKVNSCSQKKVSVNSVRRERHRGIPKMTGNPSVSWMNGILIEGLLK